MGGVNCLVRLAAKAMAQIVVVAVNFDKEFAQVLATNPLSVKRQAQFLKGFEIPAQTPNQERFLVLRH